MAQKHDPRENDLLAALPKDEYQRLEPELELVELNLGQSLVEAGKTMRHAYFPTDSIVSLLNVMENGSSTEIAVVGAEGIVGISLFMGGETTPSRAVVQSSGVAYRLRGKLLKDEFYRAGSSQRMLLRYTQALITQMSQTAVCNRHHSLDQQLCRWLLLSLDRLPTNKLVMTQELIANMLGVRREGVTESAGKLQTSGLIKYSRGVIHILDRDGLEKRVCECYSVVKKEYDRLLSYQRPTPKAPPCLICAKITTNPEFIESVFMAIYLHQETSYKFNDTNRLLDSLPAKEREQFVADCDIVEVEFGQILAEPGEQFQHVYFPLDCLISLLARLENNARVKVSMAGNEGMLGISLILGGQKSPLQAQVLGAGTALHMPSDKFLSHLERTPALDQMIKRYINGLFNQISHSAACNYYHAVEGRLARWLLMTHDRTRGDQLRLTQGFLASMLGVRRSSVTVAARALKKRGLIDYYRGKIVVEDRPGLEEASCRCYVADQEIYSQMVG